MGKHTIFPRMMAITLSMVNAWLPCFSSFAFMWLNIEPYNKIFMYVNRSCWVTYMYVLLIVWWCVWIQEGWEALTMCYGKWRSIEAEGSHLLNSLTTASMGNKVNVIISYNNNDLTVKQLKLWSVGLWFSFKIRVMFIITCISF